MESAFGPDFFVERVWDAPLIRHSTVTQRRRVVPHDIGSHGIMPRMVGHRQELDAELQGSVSQLKVPGERGSARDAVGMHPGYRVRTCARFDADFGCYRCDGPRRPNGDFLENLKITENLRFLRFFGPCGNLRKNYRKITENQRN